MFGLQFLKRKLGIQKDEVNTKKYATALIQEKGAYPYFFLGLRKDTNKWSFIGGGVENNETPIQAVVREIAEECGLHYTTSQVKLVKETISGRGVEIFIYEAPQIEYNRILNAENDPDGEFKQFRFFSLDDLVNCKIELQYPCDYNVVISYLKEKYKDVKVDSIEIDSITADSLSFKDERSLTKELLKIDKEIEKTTSFKKQRYLTKRLLEIDKILDYKLQPNEAKLKENRELLEKLGLISGSKNLEYYYGMKARPFDLGAYPTNNFVRVDNSKNQNNEFYDIIVYSKPLSEKDIEEYELVDLQLNNTELPKEKNEPTQIEDNDPILDQASAILDKGKDITLNDLEYFTPDVVNYIDDEIDKGNEKAIELETKLDNILKLFEIALDSVNLDNVDNDSVNSKKLSELLSELFLNRTAKNKSSEFKKEQAFKEIQKLTETNLEVRNLIESIVDDIENEEKRIEDEI